MTTLTIEIDERLIQEHGEKVDQSFECPCFFWLREHGFGPTYVAYGYAALEDGRMVRFPAEFDEWQRRGCQAVKDDVDPRGELEPITFEAQLEDEDGAPY